MDVFIEKFQNSPKEIFFFKSNKIQILNNFFTKQIKLKMNLSLK